MLLLQKESLTLVLAELLLYYTICSYYFIEFIEVCMSNLLNLWMLQTLYSLKFILYVVILYKSSRCKTNGESIWNIWISIILTYFFCCKTLCQSIRTKRASSHWSVKMHDAPCSSCLLLFFEVKMHFSVLLAFHYCGV